MNVVNTSSEQSLTNGKRLNMPGVRKGPGLSQWSPGRVTRLSRCFILLQFKLRGRHMRPKTNPASRKNQISNRCQLCHSEIQYHTCSARTYHYKTSKNGNVYLVWEHEGNHAHERPAWRIIIGVRGGKHLMSRWHVILLHPRMSYVLVALLPALFLFRKSLVFCQILRLHAIRLLKVKHVWGIATTAASKGDF